MAPMLIPLVGLVCGILAAFYGATFLVAGVMICVAIVIYLIVARLSKDPVKGYVLSPCHYIWVFLIFAATGIASHNISKPYELHENPERYVAAEGVIHDISQTTNGDKALVDVSRLFGRDGGTIEVDNMRILLRSDVLRQDVDDRILFPVRLKEIEDSPNYFSSGYADAMRNKGIYYETRCFEHQISKTGHTRTLTGISTGIRDRMASFIEKSRLDRQTSNFLSAILLGDRSFLNPDLRDLFADAGISHILALSGMHVAIIAGILMWILFPMNLFGYYRQRLLVTTVLLFAYTFITGWAPSTVRATIMVTAMMICIFMERKKSAWNALLLATFCILVFSPTALRDAGLQLSFICVASLIFFANQLNPLEHHDHPVLYKCASAILTTLTATLATWGIVAAYFGRIPVMFLPANLIILPILPVYLVIAIIYLSLLAMGIRISFIGSLLDHSFEYMKRFVGFLTDSGESSISYTPSEITTVLWLVVLASLAMYLNSNHGKFWKWACISILPVFIISVFFTSNADEEGFIIQQYAHALSIQIRTNGKEETLRLKRGTDAAFQIGDKRILAVDSKDAEAGITKSGDYDIVIICSGYKGDIAELNQVTHASLLVTHPSIRRKKESRLLMQADSLSIPIHSIRMDGPKKIVITR